MHQNISPIIKPDELLLLQQESGLTVVDASNGNGARENYTAKHLKGALYVDLNTQLANVGPDAAMGGRHPLPSPAQFSETLSALGITPASHVVIYDDKNGSNAAARFWWMLKAAGHQKVQVLDGGFEAAVKAGFPVSSGTENPKKGEPYKFENWLLPVASIDETGKAAQDNNFLVIDVRDSARFNGANEPIDLIAGHIPGAVNIPFATNLDAAGLFLQPDELKAKYHEAFDGAKPENVIVHCGSGVTACHTLLAIAYAGIEIPKLYVGSWSEWSRSDRPMTTKME